MPWMECSAMDDKIKFIGRILDGEKMTDLCREFGICRKTGYKFLKRYEDEGIEGLSEKSRMPIRSPNRTSTFITSLVLKTKKCFPTWGAPKIREYILRKNPNIKIPAKSTVHCILEQNNLVTKKKRRRYKASGTLLKDSMAPNDLWCADFKGQFKMKDGKYCYPLTITDHFSRYLITCEGLESVKENRCFFAFERAFEEFGVPNAIRTDNGVPFSSRSHFGLSRLSVWWLRLGINIERIRPGNPQENGRHERMHRTLKQETTKPPASNLLGQQEKFDNFIDIYNNERPHQAIKMNTPSNYFKQSKKQYIKVLDGLNYEDCDLTAKVSNCGSITINNKIRIYVGVPFGGENIGVTKLYDNIWEIKFMSHVLGYFDEDSCKLSPLSNVFGD